MTINEAIQNLKEILDECTESEDAVCYITNVDATALEMSINALCEIQQYRAIGTVEECLEAVENHTAQKTDWRKQISLVKSYGMMKQFPSK